MGASDFSKLPHIGESLKRKEDYRFLTGAGQYTDDVVLAAQSHAVFVRSPHAHAKINSINIDAAKAAPGVLGVFIGADVAADNINGLPCGWLITSTNGEPMKEPPHPILAQGKVRYVGDHVVMVVAHTQQQARDAADDEGAAAVTARAPDDEGREGGTGRAAVSFSVSAPVPCFFIIFLSIRQIPLVFFPSFINSPISFEILLISESWESSSNWILFLSSSAAIASSTNSRFLNCLFLDSFLNFLFL